MVQGKKPDGPGGDPSIVIIKFTIACKDQHTTHQVGLVPSNYLQELSQFLTQDVQGGRNGSDAPVGETCLLTDQ